MTFSAQSHQEMEEWVVQIQRFIYEGDGCSLEAKEVVSTRGWREYRNRLGTGFGFGFGLGFGFVYDQI